ncbi:MAG: hypothetical protein OEZ59_03060 [Deltaproteobacteria bacterium]|nr:hypothetical protein [Deltaproteobacteria bacterium]
MIRKSALIVILIFAALFGAVAWLGASGTIESLAEMALTRLFRTKVTLDGMSFSLTDSKASLDSLHIAGKDKGGPALAAGGNANFQVEGIQIFAGKVVVRDLSMKNLALAPDAAPPEPVEDEAAPGEASGKGGAAGAAGDAKKDPADSRSTADKWRDKTRQAGKKLPNFNAENIAAESGVSEDLLAGDPKSVKAYDEASTMAKERKAAFKEQVDKAQLKERIAKIREDTAKVKGTNFKDVKEAKEGLKTLQTLTKELKTAKDETSGLQKQGSSDYKELKDAFAKAEELRKQDLADARTLMNIGGMDRRQVGRMIFGRAIISRFDQVMGYIAKGREVISNKEPETRPVRGAGRIFEYPVTREVPPAFLVRNAAFSGSLLNETGAREFSFESDVQGITSSPRVYGKPTLIKADIKRDGTPKAWKLEGLLDHRDVPLDEVTISGQGMPLGRVRLRGSGKGGGMPAAFKSNNADVTIRIRLEDENIDASLSLNAKDIEFEFPEEEKPSGMKQEIRNFFQGVKSVSLSASMKGPLDDTSFDVTTDLDDAFANRLRDVAGEKVKAAQERARAKMKEKIDARRAEARQQVDSARDDIQGQVDGLTKNLKGADGDLDSTKKNLEKKIKDLGKKGGQEKLKKLLK